MVYCESKYLYETLNQFGRGALQDVCREWPTSRFAAVYSLNPENQTPTPKDPKDTARTLKIQCAACYSRVSGSMSAHLAQVEDRSWKRVARIRIYKGTLTQGWPVPPRAQKKNTFKNLNTAENLRNFRSACGYFGVMSLLCPRTTNSRNAAVRGAQDTG